jgi:hypothetical protein
LTPKHRETVTKSSRRCGVAKALAFRFDIRC